MTRLIDPKAFRAGRCAAREGGMALVAVLMALSILTLVGLTATFVTTTETLINHNLGSRLVNHYLAESAVEEARAKLPAILPVTDHEAVYLRRDTTIDPTAGTGDTNPFFDPAYGTQGMTSARFIDSDLSGVEFAWVRISRKTEERAGYDLDGDSTNNGEVVGYGYDNRAPALRAFQFVGSRSGHYGSPVYLLTGMATDPSGSRQMVRAELARPPLPPLSAAVYNKTAVRLLDAVKIIGNDGNGRSDLAGIDTRSGVSGDTGAVRGAPAILSSSSSSHNIAALTAMFEPPLSIPIQRVDPAVSLSSGIYSGTNLRLGSPGTDRRAPAFADGDLVVSGNSEGQGFLIVNGDLTVSGSFRYEGVILVNGRLRFKGYSVGSGAGIRIREPSSPIPKRGVLPQYSRGRKSGSVTTLGSWQPSIRLSGMPGYPTGHSRVSSKGRPWPARQIIGGRSCR